MDSRALERERIAEQQAMLDWLTAITPMAEQMPPTADRALG